MSNNDFEKILFVFFEEQDNINFFNEEKCIEPAWGSKIFLYYVNQEDTQLQLTDCSESDIDQVFLFIHKKNNEMLKSLEGIFNGKIHSYEYTIDGTDNQKKALYTNHLRGMYANNVLNNIEEPLRDLVNSLNTYTMEDDAIQQIFKKAIIGLETEKDNIFKEYKTMGNSNAEK